jgi:hypothetical protein
MIFPSGSANPGASGNCRTPYRKQVRRPSPGCRARPAVQRAAALAGLRASAEAPGWAVTLFPREAARGGR